MKRLLMALALLAAAVTAVEAQYSPNTKWPYVYENFEKGTVYLKDNTKNSEMLLNIHLMGNVLQYVGRDGRVYQNNDNNVVRVEIGDHAYIYSNRRMVRIIANEGTNLLVKLLLADFMVLQQGTGAYGSSLNSSAATDLSSLDLGGLNSPEHGKLLQEKHDGRNIPIKEQYFFIINGQQIEATKKGVEKYLGGARADDLKQFQKTNKTKWKNENSLAQLLKFLSE